MAISEFVILRRGNEPEGGAGSRRGGGWGADGCDGVEGRTTLSEHGRREVGHAY